MTGYTVHTGTSKKYAAGWDEIFGGTKPAAKAGANKAAAKKAVKKVTAKKTTGKKAAKKSKKA